MSVRFTATARAQFLQGLAYIKRDSPTAARRLRVRAEAVLRRLKRHPKSGRRIAEFPELPYREIVVAPYRFFYRKSKDVVWVVAVWHGAQLPTAPKRNTLARQSSFRIFCGRGIRDDLAGSHHRRPRRCSRESLYPRHPDPRYSRTGQFGGGHDRRRDHPQLSQLEPRGHSGRT